MNLEIDETDTKTIFNDFQRISKEILNNHVLYVNNVKYRIINIEFYYFNPFIHQDNNCHALKYRRAKERQLLCGQWYLHKISINPKCNHKGLDYTFGNGKNYGGILIKEVMDLKNKKIFSQSKFIDELINVLKPSSKDTFLNMIENENTLKFKKENINQLIIQNTERKGLVDSKFKDSPYAFKLIV